MILEALQQLKLSHVFLAFFAVVGLSAVAGSAMMLFADVPGTLSAWVRNTRPGSRPRPRS